MKVRLLPLLLLPLSLLSQDTLSFGGVYELPGAEVRASYTPVSPLAQRFTIEEVYRLPGTFYDPARLVALLPGVVQTNDQANHLSVRGNTPNANLWRLNGLAVVNPNHTANAGTFYDFPTLNGGGVNAISAQMLDNSGFLMNGLPVEYGFATGGTFDLRLRPGSKARRKYQAQAGFIGFDLMAEGPIGYSGKTSYLINGRYSFTGLLADMGVNFGGEEIRFADVNGHLHHAWGNGSVSAFGILGSSSNDFSPADLEPEEFETLGQKRGYDINYVNDVNIYGVSLEQRAMAGRITAGVAISDTEAERVQRLPGGVMPDSGADAIFDSRLGQISASAQYASDVERKLNYQLGVEVLERRGRVSQLFVDVTIGGAQAVRLISSVDQTVVAPYLGYTLALDSRVTIRQGFRFNYFTGMVDDFVVSPRTSVAYDGPKQRWELVADQVTDAPFMALLNPVITGPDPQEPVRADPDAVSTALLSLSTSRKLGRVQLKATVFYATTAEELAASQDGFLVSANNLLEVDPNLLFNVTTDTRRYGLELEFGGGRKDKGWYYRGSGTWLKAQSEQPDGEWADDRYGVDFIAKATVGREWAGKDRRDRARSYGLNLALIAHGGERYGLVSGDLSASGIRGYFTPQNYRNGFVNELGTYFRPDLRLYKTKTRPKTTTTLALDVQNAANVQNTANVYYDSFLDRPNERFQLGLIPVLSYRIVWQ